MTSAPTPGRGPQQGAGPSRPLLTARGLGKSFGGVAVVLDVDLELRAGEVHALIGENGAGKSTVIKMLSGAERPDTGELALEGRVLGFRAPADAAAARIATVFQELDLVDDLTVAQNVMLGREPRRFGLLDTREMRRRARGALLAAGSDVDVDASPRDLSLAQQQRVVIARCLLADAQVLILDEPTAALGPREVADLFGLVDDLTSRGVAVLFVSHRLEEVLAVSTVITVMRDGEVVATLPTDGVDDARLIQLMTGRRLDLGAVRTPVDRLASTPRLELRGLPMAEGTLDLTLAPGEVVGIAGLAGSGRSRLLEDVVGSPWRGGAVVVDGEVHTRMDPTRAVRCGIAYLPEDRKRLGLVLLADSAFNAGLSRLVRGRRPWATRRGDVDALREATAQMSLRGDPRGPVGRLSGGNQQKVLLARLLAAGPAVLLLDEPTRGVDIGAKKEIWELLEVIAASGVAILLVSSELPEVLRLSDRVLVMADGRVTGEFPAGTSQERLLEAALPRRSQHSAVPPR